MIVALVVLGQLVSSGSRAYVCKLVVLDREGFPRVYFIESFLLVLSYNVLHRDQGDEVFQVVL